jgi:hypothetical protein
MFIANFRRQLRLERQISLQLRYCKEWHSFGMICYVLEIEFMLFCFFSLEFDHDRYYQWYNGGLCGFLGAGSPMRGYEKTICWFHLFFWVFFFDLCTKWQLLPETRIHNCMVLNSNPDECV